MDDKVKKAHIESFKEHSIMMLAGLGKQKTENPSKTEGFIEQYLAKASSFIEVLLDATYDQGYHDGRRECEEDFADN